MQLIRIDRQHLHRLYATKLGELSPTTVRHIHTLVRRALSDAERWGMVPRNVARLVDPPSKVRHRITTLSPTEAKRFLDEAAQDRLGALFILALMTGLRRGECLALRWRDVDMEAGEVAVRATVYRAEGALVFANPKTTRSNRVVSVPPYVLDALRRHRLGQDAERALRGSEWHDGGLVFTNGIGRAIEGSNLLRRSFYPILDRAKVPRIRFHDLRHSTATLLMSAGTNPRIVSDLLGHSNVAFTLETYSHVNPTMQRQAADVMSALMGDGEVGERRGPPDTDGQ